jgi:hypothetical protein
LGIGFAARLLARTALLDKVVVEEEECKEEEEETLHLSRIPSATAAA